MKTSDIIVKYIPVSAIYIMLWLNRKRFNAVGERMGDIFSKLPLTPNQWTVMSLLLAVIVFYLIFIGSFLLASLLFIITMSIDMIDGAVARKTRNVTRIGGYLDSVIDRAVEFLIILGLFMTPYPAMVLPASIWLIFLLFGSFMSTYTRAAAFEKLSFKDVKGGILEHTDRLVFLLIILLVSSFSLLYASYLISIMAVLAFASFLQRFFGAIKR